MPFEEDLDAFLDVADFAVEATYEGTASVAGVFSNAHARADVGVLGIAGTAPSFVCKAADVDADPAGKTLVIDATAWTILRAEPDGTGLVRLVLRSG